MQDPQLWARLKAHRFDAEIGTAPYSVKLADEEGWTAPHTAAVIEEYRKFLYLCAVSGSQMTPSADIDRAWHMHLTFTRNYWDVLCKEVLGKPLHHEPCIGDEEMPRYRKQYSETKALYEKEFGQSPPVAVWSPPNAAARAVLALRIATFGAMVVIGAIVLEFFGAGGLALGVGGLGIVMAVGGSVAGYFYQPKGRKSGPLSGRRGGAGCGGCGGCGG